MRVRALLLLALTAACVAPRDVSTRRDEPQPRDESTPPDESPPRASTTDDSLEATAGVTQGPPLAPGSTARARAEEPDPLEGLRAELAPPGSGWTLTEEHPFLYLSELQSPARLRELQDRVEALRARLARDLPAPPGGPGHPVEASAPRLRVFRDLEGYRAFGGARGSSAFYAAGEHEVVLAYPDGERNELDAHAALQHILVHEYLFGELGLATLPPWLLYGLAELYGGMVLVEGRLELPRIEPRLVEPALHRSAPPPLAEFLTFNEHEFRGQNAYGLSAYASARLAWSLAYFLEVGAEESAAWHPAWGGLMRRSIEAALNAPRGAEPLAVYELWSEVDVPALEAAWRHWLGVYAEASRRGERARR